MSDHEPAVQLHQRLQQLLATADGETCRIIATFIDIRGFSSFAGSGESFDVAAYLRSVFNTVLDEHFPDVDFFKPTGDGLLLVHSLPGTPAGLQSTFSSVLRRCIALVADFGTLTSDDPMIHFPVPQHLGIGIARGSATRLVSNGFILDYTGRCLNLAARLMDKARPYGVVFADERAGHLMEEDVAAQFLSDRVVIRGISDQIPVQVYVSPGVQIPPLDREPIPHSNRVWGHETQLAFSEVRATSSYSFYLPRRPRSYELAAVYVKYPSYKEGKETGSVSWLNVVGEVDDHPDGPCVRIPFTQVHRAIRDLPATGKLLGFSYQTKVTFTPFCVPRDEA